MNTQVERILSLFCQILVCYCRPLSMGIIFVGYTLHVILWYPLNMFITMKTWITFIIHIEGPIRSYKVLLEHGLLS